MNFKDHYSARAADYAEYRPRYPLALVELLAELSPGTGLVWEAGCGSGQLSAVLGERFERVVATDASSAQIARAVPHPRVEYRCAPAESSGLAAGTADLVVAAQAAHWFDLDRFYDEVRRVARHEGVVALVSYGVMRIEPALDEMILYFHDDVLGPWWPPERRHVVQGYRTLSFPFEELDVSPLEMRVEWSLDQLSRYVRTWSAVSAMETAEGASPFEDFRARLEHGWGAPHRRRTVTWPLAVRAGRVLW